MLIQDRLDFWTWLLYVSSRRSDVCTLLPYSIFHTPCFLQTPQPHQTLWNPDWANDTLNTKQDLRKGGGEERSQTRRLLSLFSSNVPQSSRAPPSETTPRLAL